MFEDFKTDLDKLNPTVREKAIEIANKLIEQDHFSKEKAITEAIVRAKEWFYDLGG